MDGERLYSYSVGNVLYVVLISETVRKSGSTVSSRVLTQTRRMLRLKGIASCGCAIVSPTLKK